MASKRTVSVTPCVPLCVSFSLRFLFLSRPNGVHGGMVAVGIAWPMRLLKQAVFLWRRRKLHYSSIPCTFLEVWLSFSKMCMLHWSAKTNGDDIINFPDRFGICYNGNGWCKCVAILLRFFACNLSWPWSQRNVD